MPEAGAPGVPRVERPIYGVTVDLNDQNEPGRPHAPTVRETNSAVLRRRRRVADPRDEIMLVIRALLDELSEALPRVTVFFKLDLHSESRRAGSDATWNRSNIDTAKLTVNRPIVR